MYLAAAMVAMSVASSISQYSAAEAEKAAHERNAADLDLQAKLAEIDAEKEAALYKRESEQQIGGIAGAVQNSGFDFSGSDYQLLSESLRNQAENLADIAESGARRADSIRRGASKSRAAAESIRSTRGLRLLSGGASATSAGLQGYSISNSGKGGGTNG